MKMNIPTTSPWGPVQHHSVIADGIVSVMTAGHGGVKLSPERNDQIPVPYRNSNAWYEEDCEWAIPGMIFRDDFVNQDENRRDEVSEAIDTTCKNWYPDFFMMMTGIELTAEDSITLAEIEFKAANINNFVVYSAFGEWDERVPTGMVGCYTRRASDGTERKFLVTKAEYDTRTNKFVIDTDRHEEWKV